jgi:DNA mismatch endonuclease (patch repair protein)
MCGAGKAPLTRSEIMERVRSEDTGPELAVRRLLREIGFTGYRLHRRDLPGKPDVAFVGRKKAILIHGCFWHGHDCPRGLRRPRSNQVYWRLKIERNQQRDTAHMAAMTAMGWRVMTVWECEINKEDLGQRLQDFLETA